MDKSIPDRTTSLQPGIAGNLVPQRRSSKRQKSSGLGQNFAALSTDELDTKISDIGEELSNARNRLKRKVSMDDEYWDRYLQVAKLQQEKAQAEFQIGLRRFNRSSEESWYEQSDAQMIKFRYDSWSQWDTIMKKHAKRMKDRIASGRETFVRLFATSRVGLDLSGSVGRRDSSLQSNFVAKMAEKYCPDPPARGFHWEPVMQKWCHSKMTHAAHLFPYRQSPWMDDIFGKGAKDELFDPVNGLFLDIRIEDALNKGLLAIVPDLDLEPDNPSLPLNDQSQRQDRVKEWENQPVKDYKIIIINKNNKTVSKKMFVLDEGLGFETLEDLHNRKLVFKTDFRPRARYIWWTFLNTILRTAWNQQGVDENVQHQEVRKATRYWGTRGRYVKQSQLLGFVEEIGHDVASILDQGDDDEDAPEPRFEAVSAAVEEAALRSTEKDDQEEEDSDEEED